MRQRRNLRCPATGKNGDPLVSADTSFEKLDVCGCDYGGETACVYSCADGTPKELASECPTRLEGAPAATQGASAHSATRTTSPVPPTLSFSASHLSPDPPTPTMSQNSLTLDPPSAPTSSENSVIIHPSSATSPTFFQTSMTIHPPSATESTAEASTPPNSLPLSSISFAHPSSTYASRQSRKPGLSPGSIAGAACGIIFFLVVIGIGILRRVQRARRMNPVFHRELAQGVDRYDISIKSRPRMMEQPSVVLSRSAAPAVGQRQHFLAERIRIVQSELAALSTAAASSHENENENHTLRQQIEILQERNRTLEGQLQSNWALGLSDEPPPGYFP
ncbi:hypothetical protein B0H13DRAFT_2667701 [Mycena leptocephala]|nr:hypothetical protein B0H13DRAFT_2667701 [Mycena leptocephala]